MSASDLFPYLNSDNSDIVGLVLQNLLPFSTDSSLFTAPAIVRLAELSMSQTLLHASAALDILINLSASKEVSLQMIELPNFTRSLAAIVISNSEISDLSCMLLSNLVKQEECAIGLVPFLSKLLPFYLQTGEQESRFHYLGSVFADASVTAEGRAYLLHPDVERDGETALHALSSYIEHPNIVRRGGVMTTLKNCAFDISKHKWMLADTRVELSIDGQIVQSQGLNILPRLMLRLITQELPEDEQENLPLECQFLDFSKHEWETDPQIQLLILDVLVMLCTEPGNRQKLRDADVFVIVKELHLQLGSTPSPLADQIHTLVNYLKRDDAIE